MSRKSCEPGPELKIVPVKDIIIHEHFDKTRSPRLAKRLEKDGVLQDPPIVARLGEDKYVHLDGANRITVFREEDLLNCPHILVQIVNYFDPESVKLSTWCHLTQQDKDAFLSRLRSKGIEPLPMDCDAARVLISEEERVLCCLFFRDGDIFGVKSDRDLESRVKLMNELVRTYEGRIERDNLEPERGAWKSQINGLFEKHDDCNIIVAFPRFTPEQVMQIATRLAAGENGENAVKMPPGVTRHIVLEGRALRINFPLSVLKAEGVTLEIKNELLKEFLRKKKPRRYEEPTFMYDE
jgi:L-serine kinase (ATP) / ParB family transcriptional regulator, heme-responsive regulator